MIEDAERKRLDRRAFLKRAGAVGALVWAVPVVETVAASPAWAGSGGSVCPTANCFQSEGCNGGCMGAGGCAGKCGGNQCFGTGKLKKGPCAVFCHHPMFQNQCSCGQLCEARFFICASGSGGVATYTGAATC